MTDDPQSLDGCGIGPTGLKRLEKEGYTTASDIVCFHPKWLQDMTGLTRPAAEKAFDQIKIKLRNAGMLEPISYTATELLERRKNVASLYVGNKAFDEFLSTGIESGSLSEIHGSPGAGKTQLCHIYAVQALSPKDMGGLDDKGDGLVLFFDTENTGRPERLIEFCKARNIQESILDRIIFYPITSYSQQMVTIRNLSPMMREMKNVKLVIIDSALENFRRQLTGQQNSNTRSVLLNEMVHHLRNIAENYNIPIIITNQIYEAQDQYKENIQTFGGNIVSHAPSLRLRLEKLTKNRKATIYKSTMMPQKEFMYEITDNGIEEKKK